MFQAIPSKENYLQIERDLLSRGQSTTLTVEELQELQITKRSEAGYKTYTGYTLSQADADALNAMVDEINQTRCKIKREYLLDKKHQLFVIIAQEMSIAEVRALSKPRIETVTER